MGEKGEVLPGDPKANMGTGIDVCFYVEEVRMGRVTILGIDHKRDTPLSLACKVAIWCTILASMPSWVHMHCPFLAMEVTLFVSKGAYVQDIRGRTLPL